MKILILVNADSFVYNFKRELVSKFLNVGHEVVICVANGDKISLLKELGCKVIITSVDRRGVNPIKDVKLFSVYNNIIRQEKPDLALTYTIKPNIYGGYACRKNGIPYYANVTGLGTAFQGNGILKRLVVAMYKIALKKVKAVFFENDENKQVFLDTKIISDNKTVVLSGAGVNLEEFAYKPLPEGKKVHFLFMGRIMKEKGVDELLEVATKLHDEKASCDFTIIGGYEENYKEKLDSLMQQGVIQYFGQQDKVLPYIYGASAVVLPSYHEGMSNTLLESAACGRPLITSNISGCKEAVENGESGLLVEAKNAKSLYNAITHFMQLTQEQRQAMGIKSRALVEEKFDRKNVISQTMTVLFKGVKLSD